MIVSTALVVSGRTDSVTYALSVLAIVITAIVLIQGYRDKAALHAKLDELLIALRETRDDLAGLEYKDPGKIAKVVKELEALANQKAPTGQWDPGDRLVSPPWLRLLARGATVAEEQNPKTLVGKASLGIVHA